ncbi:MAG: (E)-4-hydroxy-3-methylbut-2-enyl-diphosphate synthase [Bacteroidales bacterium]|nr:(E)-4-hydroxy-3-methylbut-2-enyl-diphosphate synthase [Bacteroidales bacterium]
MEHIRVKVGDIVIAHDAPLVIQTMLNTHTSDIEQCVLLAAKAFDEGALMVRITVPSMADVDNLKEIQDRLRALGYTHPLVADVHFNSDIAIAAAKVVDKVRINPGNFHKDFNIACQKLTELIEVCKEYGTALRIGINHGSLGERITNLYGNTPLGMCNAALEWIHLCENAGFKNLVVSLKASNTLVMVEAYRLLMEQMKKNGIAYPLHLGVTEAGSGDAARMKSAAAISTLLSEGIGETIRVSLTEDIVNEVRVGNYFLERYSLKKPSELKSLSIANKGEVRQATAVYGPFADREEALLCFACDFGKQLLDRKIDSLKVSFEGFDEDFARYAVDELLQATRRRFYRPEYIACPGCGRTMYNLQKALAQVQEKTAHLNGLVIAVMGCIVNGPGEMADADYGYVGEGGGKVSIYKKSERVLCHIPEEEAVDRLLEIINSRL